MTILTEHLSKLEETLKLKLLPKDPLDERNIMLEVVQFVPCGHAQKHVQTPPSQTSQSHVLQVRAGTGGDEAALWAADLLRMYQRYAASLNWKVNTISISEAENGGYKEAIVQARYRFQL